MVAPGTDLGGAGDAGHGDWCVRVHWEDRVTELPIAVEAPAFDGAVRKQRTRMVGPNTDLGGAAEAGHGDWCLRGLIAGVTELPGAVVAPAFDGGVSKQRARMIEPGADLGGAAEAGHGDWCVRADVGAVTELPGKVVAPAFDGGVSKQRTRMVYPGADGHVRNCWCRGSGREPANDIGDEVGVASRVEQGDLAVSTDFSDDEVWCGLSRNEVEV